MTEFTQRWIFLLVFEETMPAAHQNIGKEIDLRGGDVMLDVVDYFNH